MDRKILYKFFSGTASLEEEEMICNWVDLSSQNRDKLKKERQYFDIVLLNKAIDTKTKTRRHPLTIVKELLKIAACIVILLVSIIHINDFIKRERPIAMNKIIVPPGDRVNLILSDSTNVWLNAGSELIYPTEFTQKSRMITLKGEAYFDVKRNTECPFIVQTNKYTIKVLGTKFNVQTDTENTPFSTSLLEGSLLLGEKSNPKEFVRLDPMQKAVWTEKGVVLDSIRDLESLRWREGLICFEKIPFEELIKKLEQIYGTPIIISNKRVKKYRYTGKFRMIDGVDFILQVLQRSANFTFTWNDDNTIIYIK